MASARFCPRGVMPIYQSMSVYMSAEITASAAYDITDGARLVYFAGKYWTLGGWSTSPRDWGDGILSYTTNQVWSSPDLATWTLELPHYASAPISGPGARWLPRHTCMTWVHGSRIYLANSDQYPAKPIPSDVWRSSDGTTWERIAAASPWGAQGRSNGDVGYSGVWNPIPGFLDGYFHVVGGHRYTDLVTDVLDWPATAEHWRSADLITWERLPDMPFERAGVMDAVTLDGKMFICGGNAGTNAARSLKSDTWMYDGNSWRQMSSSSGGRWSARDYVSVQTFDSKLWVLTGYDGANAGGAWWSNDFGRTWERAPYTHNASHADGTFVSSAGLAVATGNGQGKRTHLISIV